MSREGVKLKDMAFQKDPEDYQDVLYYLAILQERKRKGEPPDSDDVEAMNIAQAYLGDVPDPKKPNEAERSIDDLIDYIVEENVGAVKDILHMLSERVIDGSGLNPKELEARRIAKEFVIRMQKLGKPSLKGRRNEAFLA